MSEASDLPQDAKMIDGVIVIECTRCLSAEGAQRLMQMAETAWPGRKVVILQEGLKIGARPEDLARIEAKLDEVLANMVRRPYFGGGPG